MKLVDGTVLEADIVVLGVGVTPATDLLQGIIPLEKDKSVKVDANLRVEGTQNVYAIGDIANYPSKSGRIRVEHWNVAQNHGRTAAINIIRGNTVSFDKTPFFWTVIFSSHRITLLCTTVCSWKKHPILRLRRRWL